MSDTSETDDLAMGNHVVPTEWAKQLERERDEAREKMADALQEVDLRTLDFDRMKQEREEANKELHKQLVQFDQLFDEAEKIRIERDEAMEKYATEATEHMLAVNKVCNERDEAREEVKLLKAILDLIKKDVS